jgi:hypothetical protein
MTSLIDKATSEWAPRPSREAQLEAAAIAASVRLRRIAQIAERIGGQDGHVIAALAADPLQTFDTILNAAPDRATEAHERRQA